MKSPLLELELLISTPWAAQPFVTNYSFQVHHIRKKFVKALEEEFPDSGLVFSIGEFEAFLSYIFYFCHRRQLKGKTNNKKMCAQLCSFKGEQKKSKEQIQSEIKKNLRSALRVTFWKH